MSSFIKVTLGMVLFTGVTVTKTVSLQCIALMASNLLLCKQARPETLIFSLLPPKLQVYVTISS